jgi:pre-mRNA-processing factor 39
MAYTRPVEDLLPPEQLDEINKQIRGNPYKTTETGEQVEKTEEDMELELRTKIYEIQTQIYMATQEAVQKRWLFESGIKRSYFHIRKLDEAQIENWRKYLAYEEENGQDPYIRSLYERCLVPCAHHEEFWARYLSYLIKHGHNEIARATFSRAVGSHIPPSRTYMRLYWATFEESIGEYERANEVYEAGRKLCNLLFQSNTQYQTALKS